MTVWGLLNACRRWRFVLAIGLVSTFVVGIFIALTPGVYSAQSYVIFLAPISTRYPNSLNTTSSSLISTAGLIEREVNQGSDEAATSSATITLVDEGVSDGTMIRLPSIGGQWAYNFSRPVLDVQAVGDSPELVRSRIAGLQEVIQAALDRRQNAADVDEFNRITLQQSPSTIDVHYNRGDRTRALLVTVLLGLGVSVAAAVMLDRSPAARRRLTATGRRSFRATDPVPPETAPTAGDVVLTSPTPTL